MKEKRVTFCFIKLNVSPKSLREEWILCAKVGSLLSKLIFSHYASHWSRSHEIVKKIKHEIITKNWTYEMPHELPSDLGLWKWGVLKVVYLSFHWLNDSWTRRFELVTHKLEPVTHEFEIVDLNSHI